MGSEMSAPGFNVPDISKLKLPAKVVYYTNGQDVIILNPETGASSLLELSEFERIKTLLLSDRKKAAATHRHELSSKDLNALAPTLRKLILTGVVYYGEAKPTLAFSTTIIPETIYWETTHGCNLACAYCYANADTVKPEELTTEEVLSVIRESAELGVRRWVFTGGEPLIRKGLFHLAGAAKALGMSTEIITNATLITNEDTATKIKKSFDAVVVSLDGADPESNDIHRGLGSFEKIVQGLHLLNKVGVEPIVNTTVSNANVDSVERTLDFVNRTFKIKQHRLLQVGYLGRAGAGRLEGRISYDWDTYLKTEEVLHRRRSKGASPEDIANITHSYRKQLRTPRKFCGMGTGEIYIDSQGNVYPCKLVTTEEWRSGNVRDGGLLRALKRDPLARARKLDVDDIPMCRECEVKRLCGGGCRGNHMGYTGDVLTNAPEFCRILKHQTITKLWMSYGIVDFTNDALRPRVLKMQASNEGGK